MVYKRGSQKGERIGTSTWKERRKNSCEEKCWGKKEGVKPVKNTTWAGFSKEEDPSKGACWLGQKVKFRRRIEEDYNSSPN